MVLVVAVLVLAVLVCGRSEFSVWPFWSDLRPFWLWPFWFVAVLDVIHKVAGAHGFLGPHICTLNAAYFQLWDCLY